VKSESDEGGGGYEKLLFAWSSSPTNDKKSGFVYYFEVQGDPESKNLAL
jgi:hypothetical protein